jgi:hypothetical protein
LSERPSLSVSVKPSILPSPFASIPPASVTSVMPSLSESTSTAFETPSLSVSGLGSGVPAIAGPIGSTN